MVTRIPLNHDDWKKLIRGQIVSKDGVEICLTDIGYAQIAQDVAEAILESEQMRGRTFRSPALSTAP